MEKDVKMLKKIIPNIEQHAKHPFPGGNTHHFLFHQFFQDKSICATN